MSYAFIFIGGIVLSVCVSLSVVALLVWQLGWGVLAVLGVSFVAFFGLTVTQNWWKERSLRTQRMKL